MEDAAPCGKWKTVQPVGPSSYSATPISRPGKSSSSDGPSKSVRGVSSAVSFVGRATLAFYRGEEDHACGEVVRARLAALAIVVLTAAVGSAQTAASDSSKLTVRVVYQKRPCANAADSLVTPA